MRVKAARILLGLAVFATGFPLVAQDQYFDSEGVRIHYVVEGNGEPVVLVHGLQNTLEIWTSRGIVRDLARNYRVIALDLRGHGKSSKPHDPRLYGSQMGLDVVRLLDHLGIARAHIVGFSLGSVLTSQLLTLRPDRFLSATLVAGAGRLEWNEQLARNAELEAQEREKECISRQLVAALAAEPPTEARYKELSAACMADSTIDRFALAAITRSRADQTIAPAAAAAVTVPTLAVVGSRDRTKANLERLKQLRPDIQLLIVEGATHAGSTGILDRPEFLSALRAFLAAHHSN